MRRAPNHRSGRGVVAVEFAIILPVLLVLMLAIVELGRAILMRQVLVNLSREAANLASRGTAFDDAIEAVQISSAPLDLAADGYVIVTEVFRNAGGNVTIRRREAAGAFPQASRIGAAIGGPATLPATAVPIPPLNQSAVVAEVFYRNQQITPLANLIELTIGPVYYDVAFF